MWFHPTGSHFDVPTAESPGSLSWLHHCMWFHPTGSDFVVPTAESPGALPRLLYCMCIHPTGSRFDVPTGESLAALHRLHYRMWFHATGSRFDVPTGVYLGAPPRQPCDTYFRPRDSFVLSKIRGDPAWRSDDTAGEGVTGVQPYFETGVNVSRKDIYEDDAS